MLGVLLTLALTQAPPHWLAKQPSLPRGGDFAAFEFAPVSGRGMPQADCTCPAASTVTDVWGRALTFSRASVAECQSSDGQSFTQCASNQPRVSSGSIDSRWRGLWVEPTRQNLALDTRNLASANWTRSNVTCAHTAAGMRGGDTNGATTCTATAGNGTVLQAITSASAQRATSFFLKRRTGTGAVSVTVDNGSTWYDVGPSLSSTRWRRVVPWDTPGCAGGDCIVVPGMLVTSANPTIGLKLTTNADAVDVDFVQHELGPNATSPIENTGASQNTRAAEGAPSFTVPAQAIRSLNLYFQANGLFKGGAFTASADINNRLQMFWTSGPAADQYMTCWEIVEGAAHASTPHAFIPPSAAHFVSSGCDTHEGANVESSIEGWTAYAGFAAVATPATFTTIYLGLDYAAGYEWAGVIKGACADPTYGRCTRQEATGTAQVAASGGVRVAVVGDSLVYGINTGATRMPYLLGTGENSALYVRSYLNLGIGGDRSDQCLANFRAHVKGRGYSVLVLSCGVNDAIQDVASVTTQGYLATLITEAVADGLKVVVSNIVPWKKSAVWSVARGAKSDATNAWLASYCTGTICTLVDSYAAMGGGTGGVCTGNDPACLADAYASADFLHLSATGEAAWAVLFGAALP